MGATKCETFFNQVDTFLLGTSTRTIKTAIGDSTNNHRVPTVRQVIRYLTRTGATRIQKKLGTNLETTYTTLMGDMATFRAVANNRTDGFDINEFINTYAALVIDGSNAAFRKTIGRNLTAC